MSLVETRLPVFPTKLFTFEVDDMIPEHINQSPDSHDSDLYALVAGVGFNGTIFYHAANIGDIGLALSLADAKQQYFMVNKSTFCHPMPIGLLTPDGDVLPYNKYY